MILNCYVLSIGRKYFWARMGDEYDCRIPISAVTQRDRTVFRVGALFTLRLYKKKPVLRFSHRRYTLADVAKIQRAAKRMSDYLVKASQAETEGK